MSPRPLVYETPPAIRAWSRDQRRRGRTVALVPTMGALHAGHAALMSRAREQAEAVAASIFVNPAQFGPGEDFERYPRALAADLDICAAAGVEAVYAPTVPAVYREDHSTWVVEESLAGPLEGAARPTHFRGVLTVVLKLFHAVEPDLAVFGQKDAQQALLIRRMVRDLDLPVEIDIAPTVREEDGLALSSRNAYLAAGERAVAPALSRALAACRSVLEAGESDPARVRQAGLDSLAGSDGLELEYLEVVDLETLTTPPSAACPVLVAGAVRVGATRLIDNLVYPPGALERRRSKGVS